MASKFSLELIKDLLKMTTFIFWGVQMIQFPLIFISFDEWF